MSTTTQSLTRSVTTLAGGPAPGQPVTTVCQGWVLKKRRKKMQGYARRYFTLKSDGDLSYSAHENGNIRDHLVLRLATISSSERSKELHIDSGTSTFHIKCLNKLDYDMWLSAFKKIMANRTVPETSDINPRRSTSPSLHPYGFRSSRPSLGRVSAAPKIALLAQQMDTAIAALQATIDEAKRSLNDDERPSVSKKRSRADLKNKKEKEKEEVKDSHHEGGHRSIFGIFQRKGSNYELADENKRMSTTATPSLLYQSDSYASSTFLSSQPSTPGADPTVFYAPSNPTSAFLERLTKELALLRSQHSTLLSLLESISHPPSLAGSQIQPLVHTHTQPSNPLATSIEEPSSPQQSEALVENATAYSSSLDGTVDPGLFPLLQNEIATNAMNVDRRRSLATLSSAHTTGDSVWYDAEEGIEFVSMDETQGSENERDESSGDEDDDDCNETIIQGFVDSAMSDLATPRASLDWGLERPPRRPYISGVSSYSIIPVRITEKSIVRRTQLPAPMSGEQLSLFTVLKRNVGKDLSTVSFPVTFNEPLSLLQHMAEDLEYHSLLSTAVAESDPVKRLAYVAAFVVSGYACTKLRASRKPFNPMLGETFEDVRTKFVAEKVSHNPPIMACHAEGNGWEFWATSGAKNKFWGKSLEIIPIGTTYLKIGDETYSWQKPSSFMRNLIAGEKYLEHVGQMTIHTTTPHLCCSLEFKAGGFWGVRDEVVGQIISPSHPPVQLSGRWHQSFSEVLDESGSHLHVLWRASPFPENAPAYYGFTSYAITLNEITSDLEEALPSTDSRLRPDQRALEEGRVDDAEAGKARVEALQRQRRKQKEERGEEWMPRWFRRVEGKGEMGHEWEYNGGYWEARERHGWGNVEPLW